MSCALIDVRERKSYPLAVKQTIRSEAEKEAIKKRKKQRQKSKKAKKKKPPKLSGRPLGVLNKDRTKLDLSDELIRINELLKLTLKLVRVFVTVKYLALDGHFGHNQAARDGTRKRFGISFKTARKMRDFMRNTKVNMMEKGARKNTASGWIMSALPAKYLKKSARDGEIITNYWNAICLSKSFGTRLNVVIIEKINLKRAKIGHAILFSSDLELNFEKLIEYYGLRFQIEFNFRDAKQHFGLEDFTTTTEVGVENAANLSFLMVNVSAKLLKTEGANCVGINDLKSQFRGVKYALETIKLIQPKAEMILIEKVKEVISRIGSIHRHNFSNSSA